MFKSQAQFSFVNPFKDIATTPFKTHSVKSEPLGRAQSRRIELGYRSARVAVKYHVAKPLQTLDALIERSLSHRVIDDVNLGTIGNALHFSLKIGLGVENNLICTYCKSKLCFLLGRYRAYDSGAGILRHLGQNQAHPACGGMDQADITLLNRVGGL